MNTYTIDDLKILAQIYQDNSDPSPLTPEQLETYEGYFSYPKLMEKVIEEKKTPEDSLMEFIGAYDSVVFDSKSWQMLHNFLFYTSIDKMPLHINDKGQEIWKAKVAQWRLKIAK